MNVLVPSILTVSNGLNPSFYENTYADSFGKLISPLGKEEGTAALIMNGQLHNLHY
jgi:hypothetical protein